MRQLPHKRLVWSLLTFVVAFGLIAPLQAFAQEPTSGRAEASRSPSVQTQERPQRTLSPAAAARIATARKPVRVQYKGVQIQRVIREIGEATGTRFIHGDDVRGVVTIAVPKPVSADEALELLRAALFIKGYAEVPAPGDSYKIVPIAATPTDSAFVQRELDLRSDRAITTLVTLEQISVEEIAETIKPLSPSSGAVVAFAPTNSLILSGTEAALGRLIAIVRLLDDAAGEELWARVIRYRVVSDLVVIAESALNASWARSNRIEFFIDERTNMLLARGPGHRLDALREFVDEFDRIQVGSGGLQVVRVLNRDATEIVEIIRSLQGGSQGSQPETDVIELREGGRDNPIPLPLPTTETAASLDGLEFSLTADAASRSIIIQAAQSEAQVVADMISELDRLPARVSVELYYYEIQRPSGYVLSLDVTGTFAPSDKTAIRVSSTPVSAAGTPQPQNASGLFGRVGSEPVVATITNPLTGETIDALRLPTNEMVVNASSSGTTAGLISRPMLTVLSGEEHEIFMGSNIPIPVSNGGGGANSLNPLVQTQTIERQDVGILFRLKPTAGEEGDVTLDLTFEVTDVIDSRVQLSAEEVGVTLAKRIIETTAVLRPGQYVLLGMHDQQSTVKSRAGIPWLMDIPGFGLLFSRIEERVVDTRIVIAAKARRLRSPADDVAETIRRRLALERSLSRVNDLLKVPGRPWAVRLATFEYREPAREVADAFEADGFVVRVTKWTSSGKDYWDVYLTDYADYETAVTVALQVSEADWDGEILMVPAINEMAPED